MEQKAFTKENLIALENGEQEIGPVVEEILSGSIVPHPEEIPKLIKIIVNHVPSPGDKASYRQAASMLEDIWQRALVAVKKAS